MESRLIYVGDDELLHQIEKHLLDPVHPLRLNSQFKL